MKINKDWRIKKVDNENICIMLGFPLDYYQKRLAKIGFSGKDKIMLDAGCGAGHWSIAGSFLNKNVYGIDLTPKYLDYARALKKGLLRQNLELAEGRIENLPYKDDFFDYVICYSVWMFTDKNKTLEEFYRVLKPDGRLYIGSIIGLSWYPKLIFKAIGLGDLNLLVSSAKAIFKGIALKQKTVESLLSKHRFDQVAVGSDGQLGESSIKIKPIYHGKILGIREVFEVLARKKAKKRKI